MSKAITIPLISAVTVALLHLPVTAFAQPTAEGPSTRMVNVEGRAMRVLTIGMDHRTPGQPVIVLESDRKGALGPPALPPIPPDTPPGLRAEYEQLGEDMRSDYADARAFRRPSNVPVAVIIAAPPGRLKPPGDALARLQIARQSDWALESSNGLLIVSGRTGHNVQRDDPAWSRRR